jgi:hypothetical protein
MTAEEHHSRVGWYEEFRDGWVSEIMKTRIAAWHTTVIVQFGTPCCENFPDDPICRAIVQLPTKETT